MPPVVLGQRQDMLDRHEGANGHGPPRQAGARWPNPFKVQRTGGGLAYVWHGMRFGTWMRLLARGNFGVTVNCLPRMASVFLMTPLVSISAWLSQALYGRRVAATDVTAPVFILGHWRTGTTLLHELIACDRALGYPTTYQCFFPNSFLVSGGAFNRLYGWFMPETRPFDDVTVGLDRPQEEEFGLVNMGVGSPYEAFAFPRHGPADPRYLDLDGLSKGERSKWEAAYVTLLKRLQFVSPKPLVLKSPANTARVRTLVKLFPDARFIHIARNPFEVYPSTIHMLNALASVQGLHNPPQIDQWSGEYALSTFERMFAAYERDKDLIGKDRLVEIRYEELVADPKRVVAGLYSALDLGDFAAVEADIEAYLDKRRDFRPNEYALADAERSAIVARWRPYFDRFGYSVA